MKLVRVALVFNSIQALLVVCGVASVACSQGTDAHDGVLNPIGSDAHSTNVLDSVRADGASERAGCDVPGEAGCLARCAPGADGSGQIWLQSFSEGAREVSSVASDPSANVLIASSGAEIKKLDPSGAPMWAKQFGALVAVDGASNVYVAGTLSSELVVDTLTLTPSDAEDAYLVKLSPDGELVYGFVLAATGDEELLGLAVDSSGSGVIAGRGLGLVKFDVDGTSVWSKPFAGHLALDSAGSVVLTGALTGSVDFGGGPLSSAGGEDIFVAKLDALGNHQFSRSFGDVGRTQRGEAIAVDADDNLLVSGVLDGEVDFGSGPLAPRAGSCPSEVGCKLAGFIAKFDSTGNSLWSVSRGPMRSIAGIAADSRGRVLVSGATPGGVSPYRIPLILALDADGSELWRETEWPETGVGAGHALAVDACDAVLWSVSARPNLSSDEAPYLAKLSTPSSD